MFKFNEGVYIGCPMEDYPEEERLKVPSKIEELEGICGTSLPENYKNFLLETDGAYLDNLTCVDLVKNGKKCIVEFQCFLNVNEVHNDGLFWAKEAWGDLLPKEYIILTCESFLVMNCKTEEIFYWDEKDTWNTEDLYFVASDFNDLIKKIRLEGWDVEDVMFGQV